MEAGGFSDRNHELEGSLGYRNLNLKTKISKYIKRKEKRLSLPAAEVCSCLLAIAGVNGRQRIRVPSCFLKYMQVWGMPAGELGQPALSLWLSTRAGDCPFSLATIFFSSLKVSVQLDISQSPATGGA